MKKVFWLFALFVLAGNVLAQTPLPDLKVELSPMTFQSKYPWSVAPQSAQYRLTPGDIATFAVRVSNNGQVASGPFTLEIALNIQLKPSLEEFKKDKVFTRKFTDLKPGEKETFFQDYKIEAPDGVVRCEIEVVSMAKADFNPSDNVQHCGTVLYWQKSFVSEYVRPDLAVELTSPDASRHLTLPVRLVVKVTNVGLAQSRSTDLVMKCKEKDAKTIAVPPLQPGRWFTHTFEFKWYTLGAKKCTATVNASGRTNDKDDKNNQAELTVHIK
ncbi:MAG: hypothetical protein JW843_09695 [Candidatus Aminicenantes bacterium]|nr:hypothetical protein [Candidatus Aminicenantes bacterium]